MRQEGEREDAVEKQSRIETKSFSMNDDGSWKGRRRRRMRSGRNIL